MANVILQILDIRFSTVKKISGAVFYTISGIRQGEFANSGKKSKIRSTAIDKARTAAAYRLKHSNTAAAACVIVSEDMEQACHATDAMVM